MRRWWVAIVLLLAGACAETERCPDGQVFDRDGSCIPIEDVPADAGTDAG
jgi:hypothetical protein